MFSASIDKYVGEISGHMTELERQCSDIAGLLRSDPENKLDGSKAKLFDLANEKRRHTVRLINNIISFRKLAAGSWADIDQRLDGAMEDSLYIRDSNNKVDLAKKLDAMITLVSHLKYDVLRKRDELIMDLL